MPDHVFTLACSAVLIIGLCFGFVNKSKILCAWLLTYLHILVHYKRLHMDPADVQELWSAIASQGLRLGAHAQQLQHIFISLEELIHVSQGNAPPS